MIDERRVYGAAVAVLVVLAMAPRGWTGWVGWFSQPVTFVISPVQHAVKGAVLWVRGRDDTRAEGESELVWELRAEVDRLRQRVLGLEDVNGQLRRQIVDLQAGIGVGELPVRQLSAAVIGQSGDTRSELLTVKRGAGEGVRVNAVAVARGVHLVGRVVDVRGRTSTVLPMTDRSAQPIEGVVMVGDEVRGPRCYLKPMGDGTLRGPVEAMAAPTAAAGEAQQIEAGDVVRLSDVNWPEHAQWLVVGRVERVEADEDQPQRRVVTVRPEVSAGRLGMVTLRLYAEDVEGGDG